MIAKRGLVFRLIHASVYAPPFVDPTVVLRFSDRKSFCERLRQLRERINAYRSRGQWRSALEKSHQLLAEQGRDLDMIEQADPEHWLVDRCERRGLDVAKIRSLVSCSAR